MAVPPPAVVAQVGNVPTRFVVAAAIVLASLLAATALLTLGYSVGKAVRRRRHEAVREDLRGNLLDRLYGSEDPEWSAWVATLSARERTVVESLLDEYLRQLQGRDADRLLGLGTALGVQDRARDRLRNGSYYERLDALTWLALLRDPPDVEDLERHCTGTPRERAAAVRVLYRCAVPDLESEGMRILLADASEGFSVFGIDTLYRVAESDPAPLFEYAAADDRGWEPALLQQVLLVTRHVNTVVGSADLSWIVDAQSSPEERIRVEATRALEGYGWRRSLRKRVDLDALADDPSPNVRASTYRMLGAWGDGEAVSSLVEISSGETDERARVAAAEALVPHRERHSLAFAFSVYADDDSVAVPSSLADAWSWATAHASFDDVAMDVSRLEVRSDDA